ncbi:MAG: hypothetical protein KAJ75_07600 [Alphaproteobacteria bacterium]|nr:hypothetical protein [Alphaproteobacteria bacterium]
MNLYRFSGVFLIAMVSVFLVSGEASAWSVRNSSKVSGLKTNLAGKVKNIKEIETRIEKLKVLKEQIGTSSDVEKMVNTGISSSEGAAKDFQTVERKTSAVEAGANGIDSGRQYFVNEFYVDENKASNAVIRKEYKGKRIAYFNQVVRDAYAASLFMQAKIVSDEYSGVIDSLQKKVADVDSTILQDIAANAMATTAAASALLPLITLELQKLEMEVAYAIKEDRGFSNYLLNGGEDTKELFKGL